MLKSATNTGVFRLKKLSFSGVVPRCAFRTQSNVKSEPYAKMVYG